MTQKDYYSVSEIPVSIVSGCLVTTLAGELYPETLDRIKQDVLNKVYSETLQGVIFDMSAVGMLDSYSFEFLVKIIKTIKLLGVEGVFAGFQPGVVSALIDLNVDIEGFQAFFNLDDGIKYLQGKRRHIDIPDDYNEEPEYMDDSDDDIIFERIYESTGELPD